MTWRMFCLSAPWWNWGVWVLYPCFIRILINGDHCPRGKAKPAGGSYMHFKPWHSMGALLFYSIFQCAVSWKPVLSRFLDSMSVKCVDRSLLCFGWPVSWWIESWDATRILRYSQVSACSRLKCRETMTVIVDFIVAEIILIVRFSWVTIFLAFDLFSLTDAHCSAAENTSPRVKHLSEVVVVSHLDPHSF